MTYTAPHFINGAPLIAPSSVSHPIYNPAFGEIIGQLSNADKSICDKAVAAAKAAWPAWAATPPIKRARIFFKFRELLEKYQLDLVELITSEHGKTLDDAKGSVARAIEVVEFHCGLISQLQGEYSCEVSADMDCYTLKQPLGVCAGISPFNFPVMVPVWMMIPALACGNTFILKPSEQTPSASLRLLELLNDAGLPAGVANCLQGDKSVVEHLLNHPDIAAFTAVASTTVAETIYKKATANGKRAHTFGGAKNHCVVLPDADLAQAATAIVGAAFGSAGERCMAISAVITVGNETASALLDHLIPLISAIRVDIGNAAGVDMGPLISQAHRQRVIAAIDRGVAEGARLAIDGRNFHHPDYPQGFFLKPTLFTNVEPAMSIYQEEIFGPVLVMLQASSLDEALALVNQHQYGNGTALFTRDGYNAREYSLRVQAGMVGINVPIPVPIANHPFGGWKRSSFGDSNMHGSESINFYTRRKTITSRWPVTEFKTSAFTMPVNE